MKIKNYLVENYQLLMGCLEEELCKNSISYVRIDNEIHFLDYIIRFYDLELDKSAIINWIFYNQLRFEKIEIIESSPFNENQGPIFTRLNQDYIKLLDKKNEINPDLFPKNYQSRNKYIQKQESHKVKQKLKSYRKS